MPYNHLAGMTLLRSGHKIRLEKAPEVFTALAPTRAERQRLEKTRGVRHVKRVAGHVFKAHVHAQQRDEAMARFRSVPHTICHHAYKPAGASATRYYLSDQIIARFQAEATPSTIQNLCSSAGVRPLRALHGAVNTFVLRVSDKAGKNPLKVANALAKKDAVVYAEPDLIDRVGAAAMPQDPGFQLQWYLRSWDAKDVIATAGISILGAWESTSGSRDVVVAVIDDGFELSHPDFAGEGKIVYPLDFVEGDTDPNPDRTLGDYHGTPCAGVAIAEQNGLGVVGSAPGCAFMPVRIPFQQRDSDWWDVFHEVSQRANVISCSWGPPPVWAPLSSALSDKFHQIFISGGPRGKGCLLVFAAHNYNAPLDDANDSGFHWRNLTDPPGEYRLTSEHILNGMAAHPDVIAVSASTSLSRKAIYSNWGAEISVCAPSSNGHPLDPSHPAPGLGVWTTDNELETPGFKAGSQFTGSFGGTSSAAPLVAGVAALVLSANPDLTAFQVRQVLQETADKIEDAQPDPMLGLQKGQYDERGHSDWFGFGKVNAARAVARAPELHPAAPAALRGLPRTQYERVYLLLPQHSGPEWLQALLSSEQWTKHRWTVGYSADDAGIGDLQQRVVLAVNPESWGADLADWYREHYPGVGYLPISALSPDALAGYLASSAETAIHTLFSQNGIAAAQAASTLNGSRGNPRVQYERTYLLMPQDARSAYIQAVIDSGVMARYRWTTGFSADDAGIGDLDSRAIVALNPDKWGGDLRQWYAVHYSGTNYDSIRITTPRQLHENLAAR
ncbi:MAG: S8 family serine peptidase [Anaerolineales bacterium]|jgi:hypothetical protein|nr:S8 family serine peptidase [Anaerolineales bacterium]MDP7345608.1 S8 family serine peptidase [Anaerolineales bacterium]HJN41358.1 S8 family serine peptidase [Anaerolineales bacterium]|tara:strand:+ start:484 stop:2841 length:2358 start_codon:yes stop_codon:yes gene_type:complete